MADDRDRKGVSNQIKGLGKQAEGKIRNTVGGMTGDSSERIKGKAEELKVYRVTGLRSLRTPVPSDWAGPTNR